MNQDSLEILDILYAKEVSKNVDVYNLLFGKHEEIAKYPELKSFIQGLAKENYVIFTYDKYFYSNLLSHWALVYPTSDVIKAVENVIPIEYYKSLIPILVRDESPVEIILFLIHQTA